MMFTAVFPSRLFDFTRVNRESYRRPSASRLPGATQLPSSAPGGANHRVPIFERVRERTFLRFSNFKSSALFSKTARKKTVRILAAEGPARLRKHRKTVAFGATTNVSQTVERVRRFRIPASFSKFEFARENRSLNVAEGDERRRAAVVAAGCSGGSGRYGSWRRGRRRSGRGCCCCWRRRSGSYRNPDD